MPLGTCVMTLRPEKLGERLNWLRGGGESSMKMMIPNWAPNLKLQQLDKLAVILLRFSRPTSTRTNRR